MLGDRTSDITGKFPYGEKFTIQIRLGLRNELSNLRVAGEWRPSGESKLVNLHSQQYYSEAYDLFQARLASLEELISAHRIAPPQKGSRTT
jgi:hypothetical protein